MNTTIVFTVKIGDMACTVCAKKIEDVLSKMDGVLSVTVSYKNATATVTAVADSGITAKKVSAVIERAGYSVLSIVDANPSARLVSGSGSEKIVTKSISGSKNSGFLEFVALTGAIAIIYFIFSKVVGASFVPRVQNNASYAALFVVGLLTSLHCVAMCGGLNISQSVVKVNGESTAGKKGLSLANPALYNTGRVISYTLVGALFGGLGSLFNVSPVARGIVTVVAGLFMVILGINLLQVFPFFRRLNIALPSRFYTAVYGRGKSRGPFIVGLLNGIMPCGPLQAMQLFALGTGSFAKGALAMLFFSLGTTPLMFGIGGLSTILTKKFMTTMLKISGVIVIFLAIVMIGRGFSLSGINLNVLAQTSGDTSIALPKDGVQEVVTQLGASYYPPITVQTGIPVRWDMKADAQTLNGCNDRLVIPGYGIEKQLQPGDNIIEFTPAKDGKIAYTCWMGMIKSSITSVPDISKVSTPNGSTVGTTNGPSQQSFQEPPTVSGEKYAVSVLKDGAQQVTTELGPGDYPRFAVQAGVPVRWTMKVDPKYLNSCTYRFVVPEFGIDKSLKPGDNVIEFTPARTGDFIYTCWMGMRKGIIRVVADIANANITTLANAPYPADSRSPHGCCGQ